MLDPLNSVMVLVVTGVGLLIHIYSTGYMAHEGGYYRFFGYLNLFMFSMLTLISREQHAADVRRLGRRGIVQLPADRILFPAEVGSDAGKKAFIVNRVGDTGFVLDSFSPGRAGHN